MIVFNFESLIKKWEVPKQDPKRSWTATTSEHEPCGFSIEAVRSDGKIMGMLLYRGEDCVEKFLEKLEEIEQAIREDLENKAPMKMEREDYIKFKNAEKCYICGEGLTRKRDEAEVWDPATGEYCGKAHRYKKSPYNGENTNYTCFWHEVECMKEEAEGRRAKRQSRTKKWYREENPEDYCIVCKEPLLRSEFRDAVRDHDHITGKYRSAAHDACNLKLKINPKTAIIPVFCHNRKNYDAHLIMREIGKVQGERELKCIPNNMEKYMGKLRFVDSCQHLSAALERLVDGGRGEVGVWCSNTGKYLGRVRKGCDTKMLKEEYKKGECIVCGKELKNEGFEIIRARYEDEEVQDLVLRKGVYPYEYMDSWGRFNEAELPPKEAFYSALKR